MAGHSKWANIKHKKERADKQKGKVFSRLAKEIITAVKEGGPDVKNNAKLRLVIQKAKANNVPNENIERNIKKASSLDQNDYIEMTYELYGHGGVGIIADIMTDNKNRISSEIRISTNKCGGNVATPGAVMFNFDKKGVIQVSASKIEEDKMFTLAIESGAEEFEKDGDFYIITTQPEDLYSVKEKFEASGIECDESSLEILPKNLVSCDEETKVKNLKLIDWLENIDDIDSVYHNMQL